MSRETLLPSCLLRRPGGNDPGGLFRLVCSDVGIIIDSERPPLASRRFHLLDRSLPGSLSDERTAVDGGEREIGPGGAVVLVSGCATKTPRNAEPWYSRGMPGRGRPFKRGCRGGPGRPRGTLPLASIRQTVQNVWDKVDAEAMLVELAKKHPRWFFEQVFSLLPKIKEVDMSLQVSADVRFAVVETMKHTTKILREMRASGEMRGFQPLAELPPEVVEHERKAAALATEASAGTDGNGDGTHSRNGV